MHLNEESQFNYSQQEMYKNNTLIFDCNQIKALCKLRAPVCDCERYFFQNFTGNQTLIISASVKIKTGHVIG